MDNPPMVENGRFIGVDLAWRSDRNNTGAVVLEGGRSGATLVAVSQPIHSLDAVRSFVNDYAFSETIVAIDAPLIIPNTSGQRACETEVGRRYWAREASCHSSNSGLYPDATSVALAKALVAEGYVHAPNATGKDSKVLLEVYPHAALVALLDLPKTIKYKRVSLVDKRLGLQSLAAHIRRLYAAVPELCCNAELELLLSRELAGCLGPSLKTHEDTLDALVCAYLAYYYWYWRMDRNEVFGTVETGYILNPTLLSVE